MLAATIKADVFATSKVKKDVAATTQKPRTALLQEGENDVVVSSHVSTFESSSENLAASILKDWVKIFGAYYGQHRRVLITSRAGEGGLCPEARLGGLVDAS